MVGTLRFAHPTYYALNLNRLHHHAQTIPWFRDRPNLPVRLVTWLQRHFEILQEMPRKAFRLHVGEVQAEAHMRAAAIRHPRKTMAAALRLVGEAHGIEFFRLGPDVGHVMRE